MKRFTRCMLGLLCLIFSIVALSSNALTFATAKSSGQSARVLIHFSHRPNYRHFELKKPRRLVLDFKKTILDFSLSTLKVPKRFVKTIRYARRAHQTMRLVLELQNHVKYRFVLIKDRRGRVNRLAIDLRTVRAKHAKRKKRKSSPRTAPANPTIKKRPAIVVIDPGHGGKDPGAIGIQGTREKEIVLQIAKRLQKAINRQPGMKAILTRHGDYYLTLRHRLAISRKHDADIFIAIHADAFKNPHSHGASVFALSQRGASSEAARWLAERENHSELGDVSLHDKSYLLRYVLIDLSQTATILDSLKLGNSLLRKLGQHADLHKNKVEQARFVVLKSPDIPSVLIETGFISNPYEEMKLESIVYQQELANAITDGVVHYFKIHPPRGTIFSKAKRRKVG